MMKSVFDRAFAQYGKVLEGYDVSGLLAVLRERTELPLDRVVYIPSMRELEELSVMQAFGNGAYGGMPIQIGYCNGVNNRLNCLEYHRGCELNIPADDIVLLLVPLQKVQSGQIDTSEVEAFLAPAGTVVLLYETTLHYAPCNGPGQAGFRVAIVLPRGTNTKKPDMEIYNPEDRLLFSRNKWLLAHPDSSEAKNGAHIGLTGTNITL